MGTAELILVLALVLVVSLLSVLLGTLTYALRDYSRAKLSDALESRARYAWLEATVEHDGDLAVVTALGRMLCNLLLLLGVLHLLRPLLGGRLGYGDWAVDGAALGISGVLSLLLSIVLPHSLAQHAGEAMVALFVKPLHVARLTLLPVLGVLHATDGLVRKAANKTPEGADGLFEEEIEAEILSLAEEGEERGVVDERERQMIESVIHFRDATVGEVMTARPAIVALPVTATLDEVRSLLEQTGHSRIPVYEGELDHVLGILYARDLIPRVGQPARPFDLRAAVRPALNVPESKPLRDLLQDFRLQKVHLAMVLDEYRSVAGLVTIEDLLEELVGEISDEHEPQSEAQFKRLDDHAAEADARIHVDEINRLLGLDLPEEEEYNTLGGFVSTHLGRIPERGASFDYLGATFTVLDAEPQRVNRLRIETPGTTPLASGSASPAAAGSGAEGA